MDYEDFKVFLAGVFIVSALGLWCSHRIRFYWDKTGKILFWIAAGSAFIIGLLPVLESFS